MKNAGMSFCIRAVKTLSNADVGELTDWMDAYVQAGMTADQAAASAVADLLASVEAERADLVLLLRAQHPQCFRRES